MLVLVGQIGCQWWRLNLGEGRRVWVGEGKTEEMDGKGWKKLTAVFFFLFLFLDDMACFWPLDLGSDVDNTIVILTVALQM